MELHISLLEVIGVIICVAVLLWLLNRYLFQPITHILDKRDDILKGSREKAEKNLSDIEQKIAQYRAAISQARQEAEAIQKKAIAQATKEKEKIRVEAEEESQRLIEQNIKDIQKEENKARRLLDKEVSQLASSITETILKQ